jgi:hypothetical protein
VPPSAVAAVPLGSPGVVAQQVPLLQVRRLGVLVALLKPQQGARNLAPQALQDWRFWAFLAAWHLAQAPP